MLFNSYMFIFGYLPVVLVAFFCLGKINHALAAIWLALASIVFYGWWNPKFVVLLLCSIAFNYCIALLIDSNQALRRKFIFLIAIFANIALLGIFKYADFFIRTANRFGTDLPLFDIVLPAGISFFTFTQIAYLVDVYRSEVREHRPLHYILFVTWFPHLIAGPILHHKEMMPQFARPVTYRPSLESVIVGSSIFTLGLSKKVLLADQFSLYVSPVFDNHVVQPTFLMAWAGALAYALQIYFDFSGYSDMAIGLSRMFNVKLPLNFNSPYKAVNIVEFWRRWHMTLSRFLRDYVYLPLGGNRRGTARRYVNLVITMLLGGFWHGADWTFVLWGAMHGTYLCVNHAFVALRGPGSVPEVESTRGRIRHALSVAITFLLVVIAWIPFRATSLDGIVSLWRAMSGLQKADGQGTLSAGFVADPILPFDGLEFGCWICVGLFIVFLLPNTQELLARYAPAMERVRGSAAIQLSLNARSGFLIGALLCVALLCLNRSSEFIYFQF